MARSADEGTGRRGGATRSDAAPAQPTLRIDSHRSLVARRKTLIAALTEDPARGRLLFANAALAFKEAGIDLAPDIAKHVLHTVRQSTKATTRRAQLTAQLRKALGVVPHPSDPEWLADTLFGRLEVTPLATRNHEPTYVPAIPEEIEERLRALLVPSSRPRLPARTGGSAHRTPPPWRLDLDADLPTLRQARQRPRTVSLPQLWFYLAKHPLVRPLLELGILEVSVLPTLTPTQFRAVKAGRPTGGFIDWVDSVAFNDPSTNRPARRARP